MSKKDYIKYIIQMLNKINNIDVLKTIYRIVQDFYTRDWLMTSIYSSFFAGTKTFSR